VVTLSEFLKRFVNKIMNTSNIVYKNSLRTESEHIASGEKIITDAPVDNNGKGEAFSPTDLVATALGSCMITIMAIVAEKNGLDISGTSASVKKVMSTNPRMISDVIIEIKMNKRISEKDRNRLEKAALACPVYKSLHPDMNKEINFIYV
jgi:putative redox protein|tara:strand:+ start:1168 stop:1617 length:450 start_codon:yes stop_codon:yes gene_type:complete